MSSRTPWTEVNVADLPVEGEGAEEWLSERQRRLVRLFTHFRAESYEARQTDWDGTPAVDAERQDAIAREGVLPPGFEMADGMMSQVPLRFRKPCAPVALGRVIPLKLTSMLFGSKKHPKIACDDPLTEDWLTGWAEVTRLWSKMKQARNFGGAMGSVGVGFKFVDGKPIVEVHDPRWCTPIFRDRSELVVGRLEKRYQYSEQVRTPEGFETMWFWYRRVIDHMYDVIWPKVRVVPGEEPEWEKERYTAAKHGFGECPVVWIQNSEVDDAIDGDEDLHGAWPLVESIDMLNSQARKASIANCDPTGWISSEAEFDQIKRGSGNFLQVEKGGSVNLLEMTGAGIERACKLRDECFEQLCTIARVHLDRNEGGPSRTVEEVEHTYSSMIERCDELREQYGELGVKRLLEMVLRAARKLMGTRTDVGEDGIPRIVRGEIKLPKRRAVDELTGQAVWLERKLGNGEQIELRWPRYYNPSQKSIIDAVTAAGTAKEKGLIDTKHAAEYVAEDFGVENVQDMLEKIEAERQQAAAEMMGAMAGPGEDEEVEDEELIEDEEPAAPPPKARALSAVARTAVN
jgi:hypothetical protein